MAGPLGEMFDHGEARTPTRIPLHPSIQLGEKIFRADLMVIICCRMRRDEHDGEDWFCGKKARRDRLVWICDSHIVERTES
jgi:hypothetical protein